MSNSQTEAQVFLKFARWLDENGYRFFVHVPEKHQGIESYSELVNNYPTHSISIGPYKPDVLGFTPSNRVFAVEVKGERDLRKGLGQALSYQRGVDHTYLAAEASSLDVLEELAVSKGVGVFSVGKDISETHPPSVDMKDLLYNTRSQLEGLLTSTNQESRRLPNFADPLNELMPVVAVAHHSCGTPSEISILCRKYDYPYKSEYQRMIRLAEYLGLLSERTGYRLTSQGELGVSVLEGCGVTSVSDLKNLKGRTRLCESYPPIATFLRNRFAAIPDFRTVFEVLLKHNQERITILELCKSLIDNYPSTFLNLVYTESSDTRNAPQLIEEGRGEAIYNDSEYLASLVHSQFISNTVSQFKSLGILGERTPVIEPKTSLEPENHQWYLENFRLG